MCICKCELGAPIHASTSPTEGITARQPNLEERNNLVRHIVKHLTIPSTAERSEC
jgi:hypothetical protein